MSKRIRPVFFDLDDTLLDDRGAQDTYLAQVFAVWRDELPHGEDQFAGVWRRALQHHFDRHILGELSYQTQRRERIRDVFQSPSLSDDECDRRMREFLECYEASWRLFDDVIPTLDALRDRPLGVITNGTNEQQRAKLNRMGIADRFAVMLTSESAGIGKPDPRIFAQAAARLNAVPDRCVHVGDDWSRDIEGARSAGFGAVWINRRAEACSLTADPAIRSIKALTELLRLLD